MMRTLAKNQEVDWKLLTDSVDGDSEELAKVLAEMQTRKEVEVVSEPLGNHSEWFRLTPSGRDEYVKALGSMYEFPE